MFPHQFSQIIDSGLFYFKNKLMDDGSFLLVSYCLANAAGENKTAEILLPALKKISQNDASVLELLDICLDKRITAAEKVIRLHGQEEAITLLLYGIYGSSHSTSWRRKINIEIPFEYYDCI